MTSPIDLLYNKLSSIFEKELTLKKLGPNEGYDGIGSSHYLVKMEHLLSKQMELVKIQLFIWD